MLKNSEKKFFAAGRRATAAATLVIRYLQAPFGSKEALKLDDRIRALVRPGYYEHFKSSPGDRRYYRVYDTEQLVTAIEKNYWAAYFVRYVSLYGRMRGRKGARELLGKEGFLTAISRAEYTGPRFIYRGTKKPRD
ncbi:MAG: hypothetical protein V4474_03490 [Patescibacteria group bacterium]